MDKSTETDGAGALLNEGGLPHALPPVLQSDRDEITRDSLGITTAVAAALYLLLGTAHIFVVPEPHNLTLSAAALSTSLLLGIVSILSYRTLIPTPMANVTLFAAASVVLLNSVLHIYLTDDLLQTTNLALILMAWGLFVLSVPWFVIFFCCMAASWLLLQQVMSYNALLASHYSFMLFSAAGISTVTFIARYNSYNRVISYRKRDFQIQESLRKAIVRSSEADVAEERNDAKDTFIAHLSHELRTPLNAIVGFSETIKMETMGAIGNAKYAEYINDINDAGLHLASILQDLHDLVLVEKGELKVSLTTFNAPTALNKCIALVTHRAEQKGIQLQVSCDPALTFVSTDQQRIRQILVNLLTNAIKYGPDGATVEVIAEISPDGSILFEVRDQGVGMTADELEAATAPFWRAGPDLTAGDVEGSGLGLAITTQLVELLGGKFELVSVKGEGTTARVRLPQSCRVYDQPSSSSFAESWQG